MTQRKKAGMAERMKGNRWLLGTLVSLLVMGAAVSAGSALGKKDAPSASAVDAFAPNPSPKHMHLGTTIEVLYTDGTKLPAFEIKDFSFGVENPTTIGSATGGAGAGKVKFNEFTIKKVSDRASPAFFSALCKGTHFQEVTIEMRKAGGDPASTGKPFLKYRFDTVFTTKIDWSGPGDEGPEESITFVYGKMGVSYFDQQTGNETFSGWDQIENKDWSEGQASA